MSETITLAFSGSSSLRESHWKNSMRSAKALATGELASEVDNVRSVHGEDAAGAGAASKQSEDSRAATDFQHNIARPDSAGDRLGIRGKARSIGNHRPEITKRVGVGHLGGFRD